MITEQETSPVVLEAPKPAIACPVAAPPTVAGPAATGAAHNTITKEDHYSPEFFKKENRAQARYVKMRRQERQDLIDKGDVFAMMQYIIADAMGAPDLRYDTGRIHSCVQAIFDGDYEKGGINGVAETAILPAVRTLGELIARYSGLILLSLIRNEEISGALSPRMATHHLPILEMATNSLTKIVKNLATSKHAAALALAQPDTGSLTKAFKPAKEPKAHGAKHAAAA